MKNKTLKFRDKFKSLDTIQDRFELLKDKYKNDICHILSCGPTLNDHTSSEYKNLLKNELVISVKQSYEMVDEICDFHILNLYNHPKNPACKGPEIMYSGINPITLYSIQPEIYGHMNILENINPDLYVPLKGGGDHTYMTSAKLEFDRFLNIDTKLETYWGGGIIYELVFPLIMLLGCKKIKFYGWDGYNPSLETNHFYGNSKTDDTNDPEYHSLIKSIPHLKKWLISHNIDVGFSSKDSAIGNLYNNS